MCPYWRSQRSRRPWPPQALQKRLGPCMKNQNPGKSDQALYMPLSIKKRLQSPRKLAVPGWWQLHKGYYHWHHQDLWSCWLVNQGCLLWMMLAHPWVYPRGAWLDLSSLMSMQVVIIHNTSTGELQYHYQTRVISQISLHLALPNYLGQSSPHWQLKELWVSKLLLNPQMSFKLSKYLLMKLSRN